MSKEEENLYSSNKKKYAPYKQLVDDYARGIKPEDDVEYAIGVMINSGIKLLSRYRMMRKHKRFRAKLSWVKNDELKVETLKIRDRTCNFRAKFEVLVEQTNTN